MVARRATGWQRGGPAGAGPQLARHDPGDRPGLVRGILAGRRVDASLHGPAAAAGRLRDCGAAARGPCLRHRGRRLQRRRRLPPPAAQRRADPPAARRSRPAARAPFRRPGRHRRGPGGGAGRALRALDPCRELRHRRADPGAAGGAVGRPVRRAGAAAGGAAGAGRHGGRRHRRRRRLAAASSSRWRGCRRASSTGCAASPPSSCSGRAEAEAQALAAAADELRPRTMRVLRVAFLSSAALDLAAAAALVVLAIRYGVALLAGDLAAARPGAVRACCWCRSSSPRCAPSPPPTRTGCTPLARPNR